MVTGERRLAAVMFTDMVGYTTLSQKNEVHALQLLEEQRTLVRPLFHKHNGREIKTIGDAFLVEFASALEAVSCAFDIQQSLHEMNLMRPIEKKVLLRIGVHVGDVIHSQNDVYGDAVNVASRIESLAEPGSICITGQVYDHIKNKFEFPMSSLGKRELKNVDEKVEVYRVALPCEKSNESKTNLGVHRTAVLPFANMSPEPNDEYFADGITEEIISTLSNIQDVEVISRTSVMQYKKAPKSIKEVSRELDVGTILEGSVRKAGNRLRVTVQMIDALKDRHLWSDSYDRELQDVFAIQTDIARRVCEALKAKMRTRPGTIEVSANAEAYTMYLRAMQLYHENTESSLRQAVGLFEMVISREPGFARAFAGLCHALLGLAMGFDDWTTTIEKAEAAARKALELGPDSAEAHIAMARVHSFLDRFEEQTVEEEKAIQINPNLSEAYKSLGLNHSSMGRLDAGLIALEKAYMLDPLSFVPGTVSTLVFQLAGKEREALKILERIRDLYPKSPGLYARWAEFYLIKGDFAKAQEMLDTGLQISPGEIELLTDQGILYALTKRRREAESILQNISNRNMPEAARLYGQVFIHAALGNLDEAFKVLTRQAEIHSWPPLIKSLPVFEEMRKDPRFSILCRTVGLPP